MTINIYINNNNWCGDDDRINFPFFVIFFVFRVLYIPLENKIWWNDQKSVFYDRTRYHTKKIAYDKTTKNVISMVSRYYNPISKQITQNSLYDVYIAILTLSLAVDAVINESTVKIKEKWA